MKPMSNPGQSMADKLLSVETVDVGYGHVGVIENLSLAVPQGAIVALVGRNGAGKSTLLRAVSGLLTPSTGRIVFGGRDISRAKPHAIVEAGLLHVAEGRRLFRSQSVDDNLELGAYGTSLSKTDFAGRVERVHELFPILKEKRHDLAGALSGGQQQMLAIARPLAAAGGPGVRRDPQPARQRHHHPPGRAAGRARPGDRRRRLRHAERPRHRQRPSRRDRQERGAENGLYGGVEDMS
jgi:ABC-type uncharacterized transport system ATPase subunit